MKYVIDTSNPVKLNWNSQGNERIVQNVSNIISTWHHEVAYNRKMGIDPNLLDSPQNVAIAKYISEVFRVVPEYEPRATVKEVNFIGSNDDGDLKFMVVIEV